MMASGAEAAPRLTLDTSAYSHLRAGHEVVLDLASAADSIFVPVTVLGELYGAFELGSRVQENLVALAEFLSEPFVTVVSSTPSVGRHYGRIYSTLRRAGTPIPVNDMWIAATTFETGSCLLTFDTDFASVQGLDTLVLEA